MKIMYKNIGIIVVHGFSGCIDEISPLSKKLRLMGYPVVTPSLKGHNGIRKDFKNACYKDWIEDVERAYISIKDKCDEIIIVGFSMGGLLALQIARKYKVKSIITLNTPIYLIGKMKLLTNILNDLIYLRKQQLNRYLDSVKKTPVRAYLNFNQLLKDTKKSLHEINCDILINQAYQDDVVQCKSANYLHDHVNSKNKKLMFYQKCKHELLQSEMAEEIVIDLVKYIETN